jgi:long-chain acyl-CoA synthetase
MRFTVRLAFTYSFVMNLAAAFRECARHHAHKPAIFWGETELSYGDVLAQSEALGAHLQANLGVKPGDRVGVWLKNCPEFVPVVFAILSAGGAVVPINNFLKPDEVNYIIADADLDLIITEATLSEQLPKLVDARPTLRAWMVEEFSELDPISGEVKNADSSRQESDLAVLIYTSGTTGRPKGAMLSHGNLLSNVDSCRQVLSAVDADRFVVVLPLFHSFMLCVGLFLPFLIGGSVVLVRSVHPAKNVVQEIIHRGATILPAIPQFFRALANVPVTEPLPLRVCLSGGAPLPIEILREFNERMPIPLLEGYGLSEASPVVSMNPLAGPWKTGSIGIPIPGVQVSVQSDEGTHLPVHATGEICVRGGNVMLGYWKQPAETARAIRNGWLMTGDIGHRDEEGYFYITDRKKDMLLVNGINVYPREIEEIIYQFPGIKEAAVIGIPDPRKGEHPMAFVGIVEGTTFDEKAIIQFIRARLADYKVPKQVICLPALPRNATGKILKTTLRSLASEMS